MSTEFPTKRIKFCDLVIMGQSPDGASVNLENNGVPFLQGNAEFGEMSPTATQATTDPRKLCQQGDILLSVRAPVGAVNVADQTYAIGRGLCAIRPRLHDGIFLKYLLKTQTEALNSFATGTTFTAVSAPQVGQLYVPFPAISVQRRVAAYLDEQTAKIDLLMDLRRRQMALLKEQRAAMIQQAVTRGLDPNVPMKDSGLPWLGEIPAHWWLTRAKFVSKVFVPQRNKPDLNEGDGYYWVTMEEMIRPYIDSARYRVSDAALSIAGSRILPSGAVIASCVGNFGAASINAVPVVINQQLQAFIPCGINSEFLRFIITVSASYFEMIATAATLVYVNQDGFANLPVPLPPEDEQVEIVNFITSENIKFDALHTSYDAQLVLLAEYRAALIHECVTGVHTVPEVANA